MGVNKYDVAFIGGSGFVAEQVLGDLTEMGMRVLVCGRHRPSRPGIDYRPLDLSLSTKDASAGPVAEVGTCVFNSTFFGRFQEHSTEWKLQGLINAPGFNKLFENLRLDVDRLITMGSSEEYGPRESDAEIFENKEIEKPGSSYGYWKCQLRKQGWNWAQQDPTHHIHVRPFVFYGKHQKPDMFLSQLIHTLARDLEFNMTKGEQWRSFVSIETVSSALCGLINKSNWSTPILNLSSPTYLQIVSLAEKVSRIMGMGKLNVGSVPYRKFEVWHQRPSLELLKETVPDVRFTDFDEDLQNLIWHAKKQA